jgi:hypothetical protein
MSRPPSEYGIRAEFWSFLDILYKNHIELLGLFGVYILMRGMSTLGTFHKSAGKNGAGLLKEYFLQQYFGLYKRQQLLSS